MADRALAQPHRYHKLVSHAWVVCALGVTCHDPISQDTNSLFDITISAPYIVIKKWIFIIIKVLTTQIFHPFVHVKWFLKSGFWFTTQ